jgi:DNA-binding transcriptional LysR family regulator
LLRADGRWILARIKEPFSDEELQADILFQERLYVVAGKRSKWAVRRKFGLADLIDEAWLLPPAGTLPRSLVEEAFRVRGLRIPRASVVSLSFNLYGSLLPTGRYLAAIPGAVLRYGALRSAVKVLAVDFPIQPTPVAIMSLRYRTLNAAAQLFIECARDVAEPLAKSE